MANAFTQTAGWRYGGPVGKTFLQTQGTLVIDTTASGGAAADDLPASLFGLSKIIGTAIVTNDSEDKVFVGAPDYTGDSLLIVGGSADGALIDLPDDTYSIIITGYGA